MLCYRASILENLKDRKNLNPDPVPTVCTFVLIVFLSIVIKYLSHIILLKFMFVPLLSICCGLLVSRYMIKPHPKTTLAIVVGMFVIMIIFIR